MRVIIISISTQSPCTPNNRKSMKTVSCLQDINIIYTMCHIVRIYFVELFTLKRDENIDNLLDAQALF